MNEQQLKEAFMQYLQQKSGAQTQQEFEAYVQQLGEEGLQQEYMQFMQLLQQQQVASRKFGGMLNYIEKLRGICPEGYEMQFFKQGGQICKKCVQKVRMSDGGDFPEDNPVEAFKKKHQLKAQMDRLKQPKDKKINWPKNAVEGKNVKSNTPTLPPYEKTGSPIPLLKDSNNIKPVKKDKCGSKMKKSVKKDQQGGQLVDMKASGFFPITSIFRTITYPPKDQTGVPDTLYQKTVSYPIPFVDRVNTSGEVIHDRSGYYYKQYLNGDVEKDVKWIRKVDPSGRYESPKYRELKNEYDKMK